MKMTIIGMVTLISLIIVTILFLIQEQKTMLTEKKTKLINLVEVSYSLVDNNLLLYTKYYYIPKVENDSKRSSNCRDRFKCWRT